MAYDNQIKCARCGKSIPDVPEGADPEALLCDRCNRFLELLQEAMRKLPEMGVTFIEVDRLSDQIETRMNDYGDDFTVEMVIDAYMEDSIVPGMSLLKAMEIIRGLAEGNALDPEEYRNDPALYDEAIVQGAAFKVFDEFLSTLK